MRQLDELTPQEWNKFLSEFLIMVHKKEDNEEYEPNSLMAFFTSFEHHLKKKNYGLCLTKDVQFEQTQKGLQSKQRDLKRKGKGNKPNVSVSLRQELFEFNERETKTPSGNDPRNVRAIAPKIIAVPNNEKCPVKAYKVYAEKRPAEMKTDDAPFYLAVNNVKSGSSKPWFKKAPVGVNKLNTVMKTMAQKFSWTWAKLQKPQRQKNYDSNFSQQRHAAN
ncbi:unnamed protein product [Porites evermanni]|uniref:ZMYM2-like/QRICH1 C-terminal domain-containing protein n=1 Tax=Porites evermanni TaxID=104178 RepID=A0ABN8S2G1_9CNID|nr:unnamed protein product [Porites evermanni]